MAVLVDSDSLSHRLQYGWQGCVSPPVEPAGAPAELPRLQLLAFASLPTAYTDQDIGLKVACVGV